MNKCLSGVAFAGLMLVVSTPSYHVSASYKQSPLVIASAPLLVQAAHCAAPVRESNVAAFSPNDTPDVEVFVAVEVEPTYDEQQLVSRIKYPDSARRMRIEGLVVVGALIGKDGRIEKIQIVESAHELLNEAAMNAVRATKFTPAKENGKPIRVWARIPIRFSLR
jgi:TonB family protein